jgi:hypothetical protein
MRFGFLTWLVLVLMTADMGAVWADEVSGTIMTSPDSARFLYANKCSNGGNLDKINRDRFIKLMFANKKSQLAQLKVALLDEIKRSGDEPRGEGFFISEWFQTFHDRDGCGKNTNSYSAYIGIVSGGNTNRTVVKYLATIDDDDNGGERTLKLRSIRPLDIRNDRQ